MRIWDVVVVGAGIVGCAIAKQLRHTHPEKSVAVLEKEEAPGMHASSRNSGVIHSGINQLPGSLKAKLCVRGGRLLKQFCRDNSVAMREVGTIVLARSDAEIDVINQLRLRAEQNGVHGVRILNRQELKLIEPFAEAKQALLSPEGAIVDIRNLVLKIAEDARRNGVSFTFGAKVNKIDRRGEFLEIFTPSSKGEFRARFLVNCAGLYADRIAHMMDVGYDYCVVPFRGDYYRLKAERSYLVKSMVYPTPDLALPFLGIHLTRRTDDSVIVGPNSQLALGREKYRQAPINWGETMRMLFDIRFARLISDFDFLKLALEELKLTISKEEFTKAARRLVPKIASNDLISDQSGIRAQLVNKRGELIDDFVFERTERSLHLLNAVSPGMTSALALAEEVDRLMFNR